MAYKLTDIVNELLVELGEGQTNKFARFYQLGVACLRDQNMDLSGFPKIVSLTPNSNDTVDLPADYINYSRIAICDAFGVLHSLGRNDNLCLNKSFNNCGEPISHRNASIVNGTNTPILGSAWASPEYWADNYRNGELMGRFFGIGGGNNANGYYRIDVPNGQILLAGGWAMCGTGQMPNIVLEYLADIEASGDDYIVHPFLIETVKDYIFWKSISRNKNSNANEKQMAMLDFQKSERLSRIRFNSRTNEEWLSAFRHGNQAAVKW